MDFTDTLEALLTKRIEQIDRSYYDSRAREARNSGLCRKPEFLRTKCFLPMVQLHKDWRSVESWAIAQLDNLEYELKRRTSMVEGGYCGLKKARVSRSVVVNGIEVEFDSWVIRVSHLEELRDSWTASAIAEQLPEFGVSAKAVGRIKDGQVIEFAFDSIREARFDDFCHRLRTEALEKWPSLTSSFLDDYDGFGRELKIEEGSTGVFEQANGVIRVRVKVA